MEAVILAGGLGTRLRTVVPDFPKPMAPVAGRPFLEIVLTSLSRKGLGRAVLSVGYKAEVIVSHFGTRFEGVDLEYEIEDHPLGTGGALKAAMRRCAEPAVLVVNGDTFLDLDPRAAMEQWQESRHPIIVAKEVEDTTRFGRLLLDRQRVIGFAEKGEAGRGIINTGHYILPAGLFDGHILPETFSFEIDFLSRQIAQARFDVCLTDGCFIDIGVPSDYELAQTVLAGCL
jgi:D-glycero-alpha-D-manno-heptose 1-phosphate guanylyltransferase